jgi:hypothetical protein
LAHDGFHRIPPSVVLDSLQPCVLSRMRRAF